VPITTTTEQPAPDDPAATSEAGTEAALVESTAASRADDGRAQRGPSAVSPPVVQRPLKLPFQEIDPDRFEQCCRSLVERMPDVRAAHRYGTTGQAQHGIDIYAELEDGSSAVFQCRRYEKMSPAHIRSAVRDYRDGQWFEASTRFALWTSADLRPTAVDDELRKQKAELATVGKVFDWMGHEELTEPASAHPDVVRAAFGDPWADAIAGRPNLNNDEVVASVH
jgi:hypothetical protein